jgi:RND superfamily putative drug exporter
MSKERDGSRTEGDGRVATLAGVLSLLGGLAARRPRWVVAGTIAFTVLGIVFGGTVTSRLSSGGVHDPAAQSFRADSALALASGKDPGSSLLAVVRLHADARSSAGGAEVARVVATLRRLGARAVVAPVGGRPARLVSRDGRSALVIVPSGGERLSGRAQAAFAHDPRVVLGGNPVVSQQVNGIVATDMKRAELIALPLLFLLSFLVFRGLVAAMLPPLVGLVTVAGALLGLRIVSEMTSLSIYALNLVTGLGLGLAIDWSLFIVSRYREELAVHGPGATALRNTLRTAGRTVLFSSLTVAAALASLLVFPQSFLRSMGLGGMLVSLIGAAVSLVFLPALLALLGRRVDSLSPKRFQRASAKSARPASSGYWFRVSHLVMRRPIVIAVGTAALLLVLGLPFTGVKFTGFDPSVLPKASSGRQVDRIVQTQFAADLNPTAYAVVSAPAAASRGMDALAARLSALPGRPAVASPALVGRGTWRIDVGTKAGRNSAAGARLVSDMRAVKSPYHVLVGGDSASLVDQKSSLVAHLPYALAILVGATLFVLFLMTGSVVLPFKAIALNLLTIASVFGILVWIFQAGRLQGLLGYSGQGGIDTTQPILIAAIAFGLSTDYGVFLLTRIKEARDGGADNKAAVAFGLERTGRIVTAAACLFIVAIGAFAASRIVTIKEVGLGTGLAVLIDATLVRALLVPSLMMLLGRANWWAPRPLRWATARVSHSG